MEVLLPVNFDTNLLVVYQTNHGIIISDNKTSCTSCHSMTRDYNTGNTSYSTCYASKQQKECRRGTDRNGSYCSGFNVADKPPKAIYTTINFGDDHNKYYTYKFNQQNSQHSQLKYDCVNILPPIRVKKEPLSCLPQSDYCIIQHEQQYNQFKLEEYPTTTDKISIFLNENLQQYNGEQRYKIIRRQVLLIRVFGNSQLKSKEFQELLLVDCNELYNLVKQTLTDVGEQIYAAEIYERPTLLKLIHSKLIPQLQLPIMSLPIVSQMQSYIQGLEKMTTQMNAIYVASDELLKLRELLTVSSCDNVEINKQLVASNELISSIRTESRTKSATIETLRTELSVEKEMITTLTEQLSSINSQLKESKKLTSELQGRLTAANKKINILEINAAKDEAIIDKLRAEKAYWNRDTTEFESKQKLESELKSLRDKLNSLID